jgi:acyl dehydratase
LASNFKTAPDNRCFEDYAPGIVHEFGSITVDEEEILEFGKRYVPLSYHVDKEAAKNSIYGGLIARGWHAAALMMPVYTENYLSQVANPDRPKVTSCSATKPFFPVTFCPLARRFSKRAAPNPASIAASCTRSSKF